MKYVHIGCSAHWGKGAAICANNWTVGERKITKAVIGHLAGLFAEARRRLRQLAKEHPELTGPPGPQNRAGWEAELQEDERMSGTRMVSFRLPEELVDRIDALAARRSEAAGVPGAVGRVDIVKLALQSGLEAMEASGPRPAKKRKK